MAIKIVVSDTVGFKVKGAINDAAGVAQSFDFSLTAHRLDTEQIQQKLKAKDELIYADFMVDVVTGWGGVRDADDKPMDFSEENLRLLFKIRGVANLAFNTYMLEVGAKEKN
jgi:hypothetical protein